MPDQFPRGVSPSQEHKLMDGADPLITIEPTDLAGVPRHELAAHEGEAILLPRELLEYVSANPCNTRPECDHIEQTLDAHYHLDGSGYGAAWDARHRCARLVEL